MSEMERCRSEALDREKEMREENKKMKSVLEHCRVYMREQGGIYPIHLQDEIKEILGEKKK
jgi:hypothetical protein